MKRSGCFIAGCVVTLCVGAFLAGASYMALDSQDPAGLGADAGDDYREVESLNEFQRGDEGDRLKLSFGFIDFQGRQQQVSCTVSRRDHEREVASYGYFENDLKQTLNQAIARRIDEEARARGVRPYFKIQVYGEGGYRWQWETPADVEPEVQSRVEAFDQWLDKTLPAEANQMAARYYRRHGLRYENNEIWVDYEQVVLKATAPLEDCFEALRRAGDGDSERRRLGLFLAFFQELRYELPPDVDQGRHTLGFWVPTDVMVRGAGDCDSKAAAFCALWRHFPRRVILILVPEHALVGVEGKPRADEAYVRLGNRYFVLCEVAGPAKIPPGGESISGNFEYVMIEPVLNSPS